MAESCSHLTYLSVWLVGWQMLSIPMEETNFAAPVADWTWTKELACSRVVIFSQAALLEFLFDTAHVYTRIGRRVYVHL